MKLSEFLRLVNEQLELNSQELETVAGASALAELEVGDELKTQFEERQKNFLTLEAAKNNLEIKNHYKKDLYPQIKGELLGNIDTSIDGLAEELPFDDELREKIHTAEYTKEKIKLMNEGVRKIVDSKNTDDSAKKSIAKYKELLEQATTERDQIKNDYEKRLSEEQQKFTEKLTRTQFRKYLDDNFKLADPYSKPIIKNGIYEGIERELAKQAKLVMNDEGELILKDREDPSMDYYINNKAAKLNDLVEPAMKDFLKTSEPPKQSGKQTPSSPATGTEDIDPFIADRYSMVNNH